MMTRRDTSLVDMVKCTACKKAMPVTWTMAFKKTPDGKFLPYHVSCAKTPIVCPECEHEILDTDVLKCPTCTAADHYDGPIQTEDF